MSIGKKTKHMIKLMLLVDPERSKTHYSDLASLFPAFQFLKSNSKTEATKFNTIVVTIMSSRFSKPTKTKHYSVCFIFVLLCVYMMPFNVYLLQIWQTWGHLLISER